MAIGQNWSENGQWPAVILYSDMHTRVCVVPPLKFTSVEPLTVSMNGVYFLVAQVDISCLKILVYRNYVKTDQARRAERDQGKAYEDILHGKVELYDEPPELRGTNDESERVIYQYSKEQNWPVVKKKARTKKDQRKWKKWILYGTYNTGWKGAYARKNWSKKF